MTLIFIFAESYLQNRLDYILWLYFSITFEIVAYSVILFRFKFRNSNDKFVAPD